MSVARSEIVDWYCPMKVSRLFKHAEFNAEDALFACVAVTVVEVFTDDETVVDWNALTAAVQKEGCCEYCLQF